MLALREQLIQEIYQVPEENLAKILALIQRLNSSSIDKLIADLRTCIHDKE
jgi:hypothetical protein